VPLGENEVREQIVRHLSGEISLTDLQQWLIESTWDVGEARDTATELAYSAQLVIAERERGHRTDEELRRSLERIAFTILAPLGQPATEGIATGSVAVTQELPERVVVGTRSAGAHA
jgi:hypothetical protein